MITAEVGISLEGKTADGIEAQLEEIYLNIDTILKSAGAAVVRSPKEVALAPSRDRL